jgi:hypothetical protein
VCQELDFHSNKKCGRECGDICGSVVVLLDFNKKKIWLVSIVRILDLRFCSRICSLGLGFLLSWESVLRIYSV